MPACRYMEENSSAAMLHTQRSAGVTSEKNVRKCIIYKPLSSPNKATHSGFEIQRKCHQKSKTGVSVAPQKDLCPPKIVLKKEKSCFQFKSDGKNKPVTITRPVTDPIRDILRKNSDFMTNKWLHHHPWTLL